MLPFYHPNTIERKEAKGTYISPSLRWALYDYGDFFSEMLVKADNGKLMFTSKDPKLLLINRMVEEYFNTSDEIFGLTSESKAELAKLAKPILHEKITNILKQA